MLTVWLSHWGTGHRRVTVDDRSAAPVILGPVAANGQPQVVGLAGCFAVECEVAHPARGAALHRLFHSGVGDHELAVVEYVVAHQGVEELSQLGAEGAADVVG